MLPVAGLILGVSLTVRSLDSRKNRSMRTSSPSLHFGALPFVLADSTAFSLVRPHIRAGFAPDSGDVPLAPPSTSHCSVHSRARPESRSLRPRSSTFEVPFRPRGFAPPRRLPPLLRSRACCIPLPILGFIAFLGPTPRRSTGGGRDFPAMQDLPLEELPSTAAPRHRGRCPLAVRRPTITSAPARRCRRARSRWEGRERRLRGLAPSSGLVSAAAVAGDRRPAPSWALFLFKVASRAAGDPSPTASPGFRSRPRKDGSLPDSSVSHPDCSTAEAVVRASREHRSGRAMVTALVEPVSGASLLALRRVRARWANTSD